MSRSCRGQLDKRKQKPQSTKRQTLQDKRQRRRTPQAGRSPPSANRQPPKERKTAQQTNTNSSDQHQRTIANHSTKRKRNTTQGAGPPKQQKKRHPRRSRSPKTLKDRLQPQPATNTNRCGQKPGSAKRNAHRNDQTARRKPRAIKCSSAANAALSLLHRRGRGMGVLVGNKPLVPPPRSAPSHEISPSKMAQDPGVVIVIDVISNCLMLLSSLRHNFILSILISRHWITS